jgi:dTDP-4-dehydrorhamnose reductase
MKLLITGSNGQLGNTFKKILKDKQSTLGRIPDIFQKAIIDYIDIDKMDITDLKDVIIYTKKLQPDIIINCAAYTNVDDCEKNVDLAYKVNAIGARNIAIAAQEVKAKLIHISTDYVFSGDSCKPYREFDIPNPNSIYGFSKYSGEKYVSEFCKKYFIVRTAWLYGHVGHNFVKTIIKVGKEKGFLKVVNDQIGNPTNAEDLAYHILGMAETNEYGIYHCTGNCECSWFDFAKKILEYSDIKATVYPCTTEEYPRPAKRPAYSVLDNMMLRCTVGDTMRNWQDALKSFILEYKQK